MKNGQEEWNFTLKPAPKKKSTLSCNKAAWQDNDHGGKNYTPIVAKEMVVYGRTLNGRLRNGKSG